MDNYEEEKEKNEKRNKKYLNEFTNWLKQKGLKDKTIRKHVGNADLYINEYLTYYEILTSEKGVYFVGSFLDGWFIEKCLWASKYSLKEMASSIKKFYQYMAENNYVSKEDYDEMCQIIKGGMEEFIETLNDYDNGIYYDIF